MRRLLVAATAALAMAAIAGCGDTTIDTGKAESLAKKVANSGTVKLKSVSCPDGVKAKKGATFNCDLVYVDGAKGTITLHITSDSGDANTSAQDIHVTGP